MLDIDNITVDTRALDDFLSPTICDPDVFADWLALIPRLYQTVPSIQHLVARVMHAHAQDMDAARATFLQWIDGGAADGPAIWNDAAAATAATSQACLDIATGHLIHLICRTNCVKFWRSVDDQQLSPDLVLTAVHAYLLSNDTPSGTLHDTYTQIILPLAHLHDALPDDSILKPLADQSLAAIVVGCLNRFFTMEVSRTSIHITCTDPFFRGKYTMHVWRELMTALRIPGPVFLADIWMAHPAHAMATAGHSSQAHPPPACPVATWWQACAASGIIQRPPNADPPTWQLPGDGGGALVVRKDHVYDAFRQSTPRPCDAGTFWKRLRRLINVRDAGKITLDNGKRVQTVTIPPDVGRQ